MIIKNIHVIRLFLDKLQETEAQVKAHMSQIAEVVHRKDKIAPKGLLCSAVLNNKS